MCWTFIWWGWLFDTVKPDWTWLSMTRAGSSEMGYRTLLTNRNLWPSTVTKLHLPSIISSFCVFALVILSLLFREDADRDVEGWAVSDWSTSESSSLSKLKSSSSKSYFLFLRRRRTPAGASAASSWAARQTAVVRFTRSFFKHFSRSFYWNTSESEYRIQNRRKIENYLQQSVRQAPSWSVLLDEGLDRQQAWQYHE